MVSSYLRLLCRTTFVSSPSSTLISTYPMWPRRGNPEQVSLGGFAEAAQSCEFPEVSGLCAGSVRPPSAAGGRLVSWTRFSQFSGFILPQFLKKIHTGHLLGDFNTQTTRCRGVVYMLSVLVKTLYFHVVNVLIWKPRADEFLIYCFLMGFL